MFPSVSLAGVLAALWLLLSGHGEGLMLALGAASVAIVVWIANRMNILDPEGHPIHLSRAVLGYWPWLLKEIVVANIDVAKAILKGGDAIRTTVFTVDASQETDLGLAIYANSITLTPGTVSIAVERGTVTVHALTPAGAEGVKSGEMDRRVADVVDGREDD